jgi:signal transduction histidine kinase
MADSSSLSSPWRYLQLSPNDLAPTIKVVVKKCCKMLELSARQQKQASEWAENPIYFWASWPILLLIADISLAFALKKVWVLYGSMMIIFSQILWILFKWLLFILDDRELWKAVTLIKGCVRLFLMESEHIAHGDASRFLMVGCFAYTAPSGIGYARAVLRYRMSQMNNEHLRVLTQEHRFVPTATFKAELSKLKMRGKVGMKEAKRRMSIMEERRRIAMGGDEEEEAKT